MKFIYILSINNEVIEVCRFNQPRYQLLVQISKTEPEYLKAIEVSFDKNILTNCLKEILSARKNVESDVPDHEGRFNAEEIYEWREYRGEKLKLCTSGPDNKIIFLLNIFDAINRHKGKFYLYATENHKQLRDFLSTI